MEHLTTTWIRKVHWSHQCKSKEQYLFNEGRNQILMLLSVGGPDNRLTWECKIVSYCSIQKLDLDMLIAAHTTTGHCWVDPVECIMLLLNIAFQNVLLTHEECNATIEKTLKQCGGLENIRKKALQPPKVEEAWAKSIEPICHKDYSMLHWKAETLVEE